MPLENGQNWFFWNFLYDPPSQPPYKTIWKRRICLKKFFLVHEFLGVWWRILWHWLVSALTVIAQQLLSDCQLYGIAALSSNQASKWFIHNHTIWNLVISMQLSPGQFKEAMEHHPPRLMICSVEFLASEEVLFIFFQAVSIQHAGAQCNAGSSPSPSWQWESVI